MNTETYLRFLRACLARHIPPEDLEDIIHYYTEYFAEAGPEKEAEVMASLGSPEELARKILEQREREDREAQAAHGPIYQEPMGNGMPRWLGILLVVLAGSCIVPTLGGLFIGFWAGGIGLIVGGACIIAFGTFGVGINSMVFALGSALVMIALGSLLIQAGKGMVYLLKKVMVGLWRVLVEGEVSFHEAFN